MDRFSVCAAYYWYATLWSGGQQAWHYANRLRRIGYSPGVLDRLESETPETRESYGRLVRRHERLYVGFSRLQRRAPAVAGDWPGTRNMPRGDVRGWLETRGLLSAVEALA
jgi:hypothetical protein